ncbi:MAG: hypothetical protein ACYTER_03440 [Planctomycetota bacterium]|jgi:hypothetical protein
MKNVRFGVQFILLAAVLIAFVLLPAGCDKKANTQTVAASDAAPTGAAGAKNWMRRYLPSRNLPL